LTSTVQLQRFTDYDRLFTWKNFIVTLLGSIAAFSFSYFSETFIDTREYGPPYRLSFTFAAIIVVAVYTKNIASAGIVGLVGGIGITGPDGNQVDWALSYILICLFLALLLSMLANRLQLVMTWIKLHLLFAMVFVGFLLGLSIVSDPEAGEYISRGYDLGRGGDMGIGNDLPVIELIVFSSLLVLTLIVFLIIRRPMILDRESTFKYEVFGSLFLLLGQALSFIMLLALTKSIREEEMVEIARKPAHLTTVGDLFSHKATGDYFAIVVAPLDIYTILSFATVFTAIGVSFLYIAKHKGNIEGMRGGSDIAYLAAPIGFMLFFISGFYYIQNFAYEGGFFISIELVPMFATMIWAVLFFNQIVARIVLLVADKILPN
jgi:hypothetical protein